MEKALIHNSQRVYAWLLKLYPKSYQREFGKEMEYVFSELVQDAYNEKRQAGIITIWGRTLIDTSQSLVRQHLENQKGKESMSSKNTDITLNDVLPALRFATVRGFLASLHS